MKTFSQENIEELIMYLREFCRKNNIDALKQLVNELSEELKIAIAKESEYYFGCIDNPSDIVCKTAIKYGSFNTIGLIKNQTEELQLLALKKSPISFKCIKNPTKKAVEYFIEHIEDGIDEFHRVPALHIPSVEKYLKIMGTSVDELKEKTDNEILKLKLELI